LQLGNLGAIGEFGFEGDPAFPGRSSGQTTARTLELQCSANQDAESGGNFPAFHSSLLIGQDASPTALDYLLLPRGLGSIALPCG